MAKNKSRKRSSSLRLFAVLLIAAAVVVVAVLVAQQNSAGLKAFWRQLRGKPLVTDLYYENCSDGEFAMVGNSFAAASNSSLMVFGPDGESLLKRIHSYSNVRMAASGDLAVVYDLGKTSFSLFNGSGEIITTMEAEGAILSVTVNEAGYTAVCAGSSGYYGAVTVYNPNGTAIFKWYSGENRLLTARVLGNNELLAVTVGDGGSRLVHYALGSEEEQGRLDYPGLAVGIEATDDGVALLTTDALVWVDVDTMSITHVYGFGGRYLTGCAAGDSAVTLALSEFPDGGSETLINVGADGAEKGRYENGGDLVDMDPSGGWLSALYTDAVAVLDSDLSIIYRVDHIPDALQTVLTAKGEAVTAGAFSAHTWTKQSDTRQED